MRRRACYIFDKLKPTIDLNPRPAPPVDERRAAAWRHVARRAVVLACLCLAPLTASHGQLSLPGLTGGDSGGSGGGDSASADEAVQAEIAEARRELESVEEELARFNEQITNADARIARIRERIAANEDLAGVDDIEIDNLARAELDAVIDEQREQLSAERSRIVELDSTLAELIQAPARLAQQREALTRDAPSRPAEIGSPPSDAGRGGWEATGEPVADGADSDPQATLRSLRRTITQKRLELTRNRLANNETLNALATAERDLERRTLAQRETFLERALERVRHLREEEAERSLSEAREARRQTAFEPTVVRSLAEEVVSLKEETANASRRGGLVSEQLQEVSSRLERISDDFLVTRERVEVVGPSPAIGRMLRRRLAGLPSSAGYRRGAKARRAEISEVIDRQIDIDEDLRQFGPVHAEVTDLMSQIKEPVKAEDVDRIRDRLQSLLVEKRTALGELHAQYGAVAARLTQLDQAQRDLVNKAREFVDFIEGELMTIPSQPVLHAVGPQAWLSAFDSLLHAETWRQLLSDVVTAIRGSLPTLSIIALAAAGIFLSRKRAAREIRRIAPLTRKIRTDRMRLTVVVVGCTLILCAFLPVVIGGVGWIIQRASVSDLSTSLGAGLVRVGAVLLLFGFVRQMVRVDGLALRHFRWTEETGRRIWRNLGWFIPSFAAAIAVTRFTFDAGIDGWNLISRVAFLVAMALAVVYFWRVSKRLAKAERYADALTEMSDPLVHRRSRWFLPLTLVLLFAALMSYLGYHYTAMRLDSYFSLTVVLLVVLMLLHNLLLRWSTLVQRRLRFAELLKRREDSRTSRTAGESEQGVSEVGEVPVEEQELDVVGLGEQARRVVSAALVFIGIAGLYLIWDDLFPALRVLDEVKLPFSHLAVVDGVESEVAVTLTDLGVSLLVFVATFIGARNLPGLLEFVVLQRLPIDAGARYATITIARYLIVAIGVIVGFSLIGADWSKLQWLIAALGVGLGFGLQEIVANFISGIILLFERPIRVGDIITLGDTDGVVTRIRIRATTIRNWDQRELVVPNKEFITGRLLNWTLSDPINRLMIHVGVAYGSDVDKALDIMLEIAENHPHVLDDPRPVVAFEAFGASSLDLTLRCYQSGLDWRLPALNEINKEIYRRFAEAGIEIPFAQRDVHLRRGDPLEVVFRRDARTDD